MIPVTRRFNIDGVPTVVVLANAGGKKPVPVILDEADLALIYRCTLTAIKDRRLARCPLAGIQVRCGGKRIAADRWTTCRR